MNTTTERDSGAAPRDDRPIVAIVDDVLHKTETLMRQELQLGIADAEGRLSVLRADLGAQLEQAKVDLTAKVIGGAIAFIGALTLTAAVVLLLTEAEVFDRHPWLAALIVGAVISVVGVVLLMRNVRAPHAPPEIVPKRAFESIQPDVKSIEKAIK